MAQEKQNPLVTLVRYSEIGFILPAAVLLGYLVGTGLDYWLHTKWIVVAGVIFGVISGFVSMIRMALRSDDEQD
ncbi:MAG: AtpZ/AtpI family protein [Terriglobia bacterium]|jgi:F0F1-type ATP synthase assembly protein I|nr:AtpZ/AtpI family protein [Terriglobia bacterium]